MSQDQKTATKTTEIERHLSFSLGAEEYGIPLLRVREVIAMPEITPIPQTPGYFLGIMNLRGQVISVIDLRVKLGIQPSTSKEKAVIICDLGGACIGVVVDSVNHVLSPAAENVAPPPDLKGVSGSEHVTAVCRTSTHLVLFLDIARALNIQDRKIVSDVSAVKAV